MSILTSKISSERLKKLILDLKWYHTLEFPNGIVTKGVFNHKPFLEEYRFPDSLKNQDVLDVGAGDGFFSFEFERRGAKSVLAIDTNKFDGSMAINPSPSKRDSYHQKYSFYAQISKEYSDIVELLDIEGLNQLIIAKNLLNSKIIYKSYSVYDLDSIGKTFDLIFCGDLIQHLKNPLNALEQLYGVTKKLCIISLATPLSKIKNKKFIIRRILKKLKLHGEIIYPNRLVKYVGNQSGGAFFYFHPLSFKEALLASGFKNVDIISNFDLPSRDNIIKYPHTIFHCYI